MVNLRTRSGRGAMVFVVIGLAAIALGAVVGLWWGQRAGAPGETTDTRPAAPARPPVPEGPNRLVLTEAQLTEMLRRAAGNHAAEAQVTLEPGQMVVTGTVKKGALGLPLRVVLEPTVENGALAVVVREAKMGGLPLPQEVTTALAGRVKQALYQEQQKIKGLVIDTVEVKDRELVLTGHFAAGTTAGGTTPRP